MRIAILHLSDFHVSDGERFVDAKIKGVLSSLNILEHIDDYIIAFSGDLSYSGHINEFKQSRYLFGRFINGLESEKFSPSELQKYLLKIKNNT